MSVILRSHTPAGRSRQSARVRDHHNLQPSTPLRFHTYGKFSPQMADAIDLQSLLDKLADFLLQSGFAGGKMQSPYWDDMGQEQDRSMDALREAILNALMESGQFTAEMLEALRGDGKDDGESAEKLAKLLDDIISKLVEEGYLNVDAPPQMPASHQPVTGPGGLAHAASKDVQFSLSEKGIDFLGFKTLRSLLGSLGRSSFGSHDTPYQATGIEADGSSKEYEFGDTLNLDVNATLQNALIRNGNLDVPIDLDYGDLMVRQAEYRSSCATVLLLDTSHSMILYGEDRFTPAKKVALALTHLIRTQFPGDTIRVVLFHDSAEEIPLNRLATRASRAVSHQHGGGAQARATHSHVAEKRHAADRDDHRRQTERAHDAQRDDLQELDGARRHGHRRDAARGRGLPPVRHRHQHLHARARPRTHRVREAHVRDQPRQGVLHEHDDARSVHSHGFPEAEDAEGVVAPLAASRFSAFHRIAVKMRVRPLGWS